MVVGGVVLLSSMFCHHVFIIFTQSLFLHKQFLVFRACEQSPLIDGDDGERHFVEGLGNRLVVGGVVLRFSIFCHHINIIFICSLFLHKQLLAFRAFERIPDSLMVLTVKDTLWRA
jgi:hypothetical protein